MAVQVETLEKLERRITIMLAADNVNGEVESRLKKLSRTVKADGFRPGKVPMSVVAQRYGYSVHYEVMNDKVGQVFNEAVNEAKLRVAGSPKITEKEGAPEGQVAFDATFEVYPEVKLGDIGTAEVERVSTEVTEAAIDKTLDILRKQRRTFQQRAASEGAAEGDRVTIDFEGKIDGVPFEGGKAEAFSFTIDEDKQRYLELLDGKLLLVTNTEAPAAEVVARYKSLADIERGMAIVTEEIESGKFEWSLDLEDVHLNIEKRLTAIVGDAGKRLHTGRSRNDQVATDIRLYLRDAIDHIVTLIAALQTSLLDLAEQGIAELVAVQKAAI